jgi:rhodanese-related sulfurtransferase
VSIELSQKVAPASTLPNGRPSRAEPASLQLARARAQDEGLPYAGVVDPATAHELFRSDGAVLVDVRTAEERKFVGHVPGSIHVAWQTGAAMIKNPRFLKELSAKVPADAAVLFICRSGKRSSDAAAAATKAGYSHAFNVSEGFEGDLDANAQRGSLSGWRHRGLPWVQD